MRDIINDKKEEVKNSLFEKKEEVRDNLIDNEKIKIYKKNYSIIQRLYVL